MSTQYLHLAARTQLRPHINVLVIGTICFLFFTGIAVLSNLFPNPTVTVGTTTTFLAFAFLGVVIIAAALLERCTLSAEGISSRNMIGVTKSARWSEVAQVGYNQNMQWFYLRTASGQVLHVSVMMVGLPKFAEMMLTHLPTGVADPELQSLLGQIARGQVQEPC